VGSPALGQLTITRLHRAATTPALAGNRSVSPIT